jgi:hypothetical protein
MRLFTTLIRSSVALALLVVAPFAAHATSPDDPIDVLPLQASAAKRPGALRVMLKDPGILELDVESTVLTDGKVAAEARTTGLSVASAATLPAVQRTIPGQGPQAAPVLPRALDLPAVHSTDLTPGLYAERLIFTVVVRGLEPRELTFLRYFEVTANGTTPITSDEYSKRTDREFAQANGITYRMGTASQPGVKPEAGPSGNPVLHRTGDTGERGNTSERDEK